MILSEPQLEGYDIIGDVHGCADELVTLLEKLGYSNSGGVWRHRARKAVFVGDVLDRGPKIRQAMQLVRAMVDANQAYMVLGNHEYNAIIYSVMSQKHITPRLQRYYRRLGRHLRQTLLDYRHHLQEWKDLILWLQQLPICLEFPNFRVVHACWDGFRISQARQHNAGRVMSDKAFLSASLHPATEPNRVIERLLKGTDMLLPEGQTILGSDGIQRDRFRTKFWSQSPQTYGDVVFQPDKLPDTLMDRPLSGKDRGRLLTYAPQEKALFVGHYWCSGQPRLISENLACLDYSAVKNGLLVAYRIGKEDRLTNENFIWVANARPNATPC